MLDSRLIPRSTAGLMSEFRQFLAIANGRFPGQGRVAQEAKRDGGDIPFGLDYAENFILGHLKMEGALIVLREMIAPAAQRIGEVGERGKEDWVGLWFGGDGCAIGIDNEGGR